MKEWKLILENRADTEPREEEAGLARAGFPPEGQCVSSQNRAQKSLVGLLASEEKGECGVGSNKPRFPLQPTHPMPFHPQMEKQGGDRDLSLESSLLKEGVDRWQEEASPYCLSVTA